MKKAITACTMRGMTVRQGALHFGVPKSTLGDRISGRVLPGATSGPKAYLTSEEEEELVKFLLRCVAIGYPKSRHEVLALMNRLLEKKGIPATVTRVAGGNHFVVSTQTSLSGLLLPLQGYELVHLILMSLVDILTFWSKPWLKTSC